MKIDKKDLGKCQLEITVEMEAAEFRPFIERGADAVAQEVKIDGFRPGKAPYDLVRAKVGEMTILEEAARLVIRKEADRIIDTEAGRDVVGDPRVDITKLAPDNPFVFKITVTLLPEIKLATYKGLGVKKDAPNIEDGAVDKVLDELRALKAVESPADKPLGTGDKAVFDIDMSIALVPVESGQGRGVEFIAGQGWIVPGFDQEVLGIKAGETRAFQIKYPEEFHMKNLAGQPVDFKVTAKSIMARLLPAMDDALAAGFGAATLLDLKAKIRESLTAEKDRETRQQAEMKMLETILKDSHFSDLPEPLVNREVELMMHELEHTVEHQGGSFEDYLSHIKKTRDQIVLDLLPDAVKRVKTSLVIREIGRLEKISVEERDIDAQLEALRKYLASSDREEAKGRLAEISEPGYRQYLASVLGSRKILDQLAEWNIV